MIRHLYIDIRHRIIQRLLRFHRRLRLIQRRGNGFRYDRRNLRNGFFGNGCTLSRNKRRSADTIRIKTLPDNVILKSVIFDPP